MTNHLQSVDIGGGFTFIGGLFEVEAHEIICKFHDENGRTVLYEACDRNLGNMKKLITGAKLAPDGKLLLGAWPADRHSQTGWPGPFLPAREKRKRNAPSCLFIQEDADPRNNFYRLVRPANDIMIWNESSRAIRLEADGKRWRVAAGAKEPLSIEDPAILEEPPEVLLLLDPGTELNVARARVRYGAGDWLPACVTWQSGPYLGAYTLLIHDAEDLLGRLESWSGFDREPLLDMLSFTGMGCGAGSWFLCNISSRPLAVRFQSGARITLPPDRVVYNAASLWERAAGQPG